MAGYDTFVSALETVFDFHSARVIAREASVGAGLEDRNEWTPDDYGVALAQVAPPVGKDLRPAMERLGLAPSEDSSTQAPSA